MISDHAVLRFMQRCHGIDVEAYRRELAARVENAIAAGATSVKVAGFVFHIKGGVLATVVPAKQRHVPRSRKARGTPSRRDWMEDALA